MECIIKEAYSLSTKYDTILILEINSEPNEEAMKNFCQINNLKNLMNEPAYGNGNRNKCWKG